MTPKDLEVLEAIEELGQCRPKDLAEYLGHPDSAHIMYSLRKLTNNGYLLKTGKGNRVKYEKNENQEGDQD